jgi:hypothetical protein
LAWHFCTNKNSKKLEKVQERALRFVYEDYNSSYEELLQKAKVPSLQIRRMRTMALETYKIIRTATFGPIPGLQKTLELRDAIFSPEMISEAVPQCRCLLIMLVSVLSTQYYYFIFIIIFFPAASFLNAALCWSICVWFLNKSPKRHLPCGFLFRSIHSPPFYACMS